MAHMTVDSAVSQDDLVIPVCAPSHPFPLVQYVFIISNHPIQLIDFSAFLSGDAAAKQQTARAVLNGFQTAGFIYLKNHGIAPSTISTVFAHSAQFFARPQPQKDALAWYSAAANRGYVTQGREKLVVREQTGTEAEMRKTVPDLKESMEIGRDDQPLMPNMWPTGDEQAVQFKQQMLGFFETCKGLHTQVMRAIALGMGIEEHWFDGFTDAGDNTLRLLHYPSVSKAVFKRDDGQVQVRAGEHSDYGICFFPFSFTEGSSTHCTIFTWLTKRSQAPLPYSSRINAAACKSAPPKAPL